MNSIISRIFKKNSTPKKIHAATFNCYSPGVHIRGYESFCREGYAKNVIVFRAINLVASSLASIPIKVFSNTPEGTITEKNHPLTRIVSHPNPLTSRAEFFESTTSYKLISGNCFILKLGTEEAPIEMHVLRPDRVKILIDEQNNLTGYQYRIGKHIKTYPVNPVTGESDVLHLRTFNPNDDWYGLSPLEAASCSINQHNQSAAWNQAILKNGARPSGALVVKPNKDGSGGQLEPEQYERLKEQVNQFYSGADNAGRPLLLEGGIEWKEMSLSPKDMDFIACKNSAARDIALAFGVPPQLLGIPGDNTYANLIEARIALWEQTVIPMFESILNQLNRWLVKPYYPNTYLSFRKDDIPTLASKQEKIWKYVNDAEFMTINEKREAFGLHPINIDDLKK